MRLPRLRHVASPASHHRGEGQARRVEVGISIVPRTLDTTLEVKAKVEEMQAQQEFLEALIKELEEKHRIELRKKAILKN